MNREFFTPEFVRSLDRLAFLARRLKRGRRPGRYRSHRRGSSLEFASFRPYLPGDEVRNIDLNLLRRRGKLFTREFEAEEELNVYLLLDASESMRFGAVPRFDLGRRVAAALAYIAVKSGNSAACALLRDGGVSALVPRRGRGALHAVFEHLGSAAPGGGTALNRSLKAAAEAIRRPGFVLVLSDFLDGEEFEEGLGRLVYAGNQLMVLRIGEDDERETSLFAPGEYRLRDAENGRVIRVSLTRTMLARYLRERDEHELRIRRFCHLHEVPFLAFPSTDSHENVVLRYLVERGTLR